MATMVYGRQRARGGAGRRGTRSMRHTCASCSPKCGALPLWQQQQQWQQRQRQRQLKFHFGFVFSVVEPKEMFVRRFYRYRCRRFRCAAFPALTFVRLHLECAQRVCVWGCVCVSSAAQAKHIIASASTALAATANACCLLYAAAAAASAGNLCSPPLPAPPPPCSIHVLLSLRRHRHSPKRNF